MAAHPSKKPKTIKINHSKRKFPPIADRSGLEELEASLRADKLIAVDTEFIRESTFFPQLEWIQIGTLTAVYLIDAQAFKTEGKWRSEDLQPLYRIFKNPTLLKIFHAAQGDQECFAASFGLAAEPSLDTAIAASLCGYGENIGLAALLKEDLGIKLEKGHTRSHWSMRPLPPQLLEYAYMDVYYLVELAKNLMTKLKTDRRLEWAKTLSKKWEQVDTLIPSPEQYAEKILRSARQDPLTLSVYRELLVWRENRVRELNRPRKWIAEDGLLLDLALAKPKNIDQLGTFRGLNKGELKSSSEDILTAVQIGVTRDRQELQLFQPAAAPFLAATDEQRALGDFVKVLVQIRAKELRIAPSLLTTGLNALQLVLHADQPVVFWIREGWIHERTAETIGKEIKEFLSGKRVVQVVNQKLHLRKPSAVPAGKTKGKKHIRKKNSKDNK